MQFEAIADRNRIFYTLSGSRAYSLSTPTSDDDYRGVFIGEPSNVFGLYPCEQVEKTGDNVVYEMGKFIRLAKDCNPNIIELLYMPASTIIETTPWWEMLQDNRHLFLSRKARFTFSGYAMAQLKKIRSHYQRIIQPWPEAAPLAADYIKEKHFDGIGLTKVFDQNAFDTAHKQWRHYWDWKANRNEKRAALEESHGYDTKHAMHLVRLMRMCREILETGEVIVQRPDAAELRALREGAWSYEELLSWAENMDAEMAELYEKSPLPHSSDIQKIDALMVDIYTGFWRQRQC